MLTDSKLAYLRFDGAISEAKKTSKNPKKNAEKFGGKEKVATFAPAKPNNTGFSKTFSLKDWQKKSGKRIWKFKNLAYLCSPFRSDFRAVVKRNDLSLRRTEIGSLNYWYFKRKTRKM